MPLSAAFSAEGEPDGRMDAPAGRRGALGALSPEPLRADRLGVSLVAPGLPTAAALSDR
ncbi:hypothetical protein OG590_29330 [Streptomyces goshikiensis]|uniref:hypothetical protein n=1 Tax=Streptomyces goshikiensis TaxID=1942 RepID=UPI002E121150|nr:hypothetical protein OG224_07790 [Streptomyces goshikiensis]WSY00989.1 hypothetical protein OG590_29330 [Streptomyces goshikiensis]